MAQSLPVTRPRTNRVALTTGHDLSWMRRCMKRVSVKMPYIFRAVQASILGQIRSDRWPKAGWLHISRRIIPMLDPRCPQIFRCIGKQRLIFTAVTTLLPGLRYAHRYSWKYGQCNVPYLADLISYFSRGRLCSTSRRLKSCASASLSFPCKGCIVRGNRPHPSTILRAKHEGSNTRYLPASERLARVPR